MTRATLGALRAIGMGSKLLLLLYMGRALAPAELGVYGIFTSTAAFVLVLIGLEYHQHAVRAIVQGGPAQRGTVVLSQLRVYLFTYAAAPLVVWPMFAVSGMPGWCAVYLAAVCVGLHVAQETQRLLTALSRPIIAQVIIALANGAWVFPVLAIGWAKPKAMTLELVFGAWAGGAWTAALVGLLQLRALGVLRGGRWADAKPDVRGVRSGLLFLGSALCFFAIDTIDRYALEWFRSTTEVGIYTFHASIARSHRDLLFAVAVAPVVPLLLAARGKGHDAAAARRAARVLPASSIGLGLLLVLAIHAALYVAHKPVLAAHVGIFYLLIAGNVAVGLSTAAHYGLYAQHRETLILWAHLSGLVIEAVACVALVPRFGVMGTAVANTLALFAIAGIKYVAHQRLRRVEPQQMASSESV